MKKWFFGAPQDDLGPTKRNKVCVIGAGASGLVTMKELLDENQEIVAFEATQFVGGAFSVGADASTANRSYKSLHLTISNNYMAFSDYPPKDDWKFWTGMDYAYYLQDYANHFKLTPHIRFGTRVTMVEPSKTGYLVTTKEMATGIETTTFFDAVAVSIGSHQKPNLPCVDQLDSFKGTVDHS